jgi:hypothetical protein
VAPMAGDCFRTQKQTSFCVLPKPEPWLRYGLDSASFESRQGKEFCLSSPRKLRSHSVSYSTRIGVHFRGKEVRAWSWQTTLF